MKSSFVSNSPTLLGLCVGLPWVVGRLECMNLISIFANPTRLGAANTLEH